VRCTCAPRVLLVLPEKTGFTDWRCGLSQSANCNRRVRTRALHPTQLHQLFNVSITTRTVGPSAFSQLVCHFKRVSFPRQRNLLTLTPFLSVLPDHRLVPIGEIMEPGRGSNVVRLSCGTFTWLSAKNYPIPYLVISGTANTARRGK